MPRWEVPVVYRGQDSFIIDEPDVTTPEQAAEAALHRFRGGVAPDDLGNEWQEPERVGVITHLDIGEQHPAAPTDNRAEVFVLRVTDEDTTILESVHSTREKAVCHLARHCRAWWDELPAVDPTEDLSADDAQAVREFFTEADSWTYDITPTPLDPEEGP
jgi:hypothetical protein